MDQISNSKSIDKFENVFLIDDDYATNYFHEIVVTDSGKVKNHRFFSSTVDALDFFKKMIENQDENWPEIVFLDINLPRMTGWEFLEEFKHLDISPKPIFIMLSTSLNPADIIKAEENPLVLELIDKPLTKEYLYNLKNKIKSIV